MEKKEREKEIEKEKKRKKERKKKEERKKKKERNKVQTFQHVFLPESLQIVELQALLLTTEWLAVVFQKPEF